MEVLQDFEVYKWRYEARDTRLSGLANGRLFVLLLDLAYIQFIRLHTQKAGAHVYKLASSEYAITSKSVSKNFEFIQHF